ALPRNLPRRHPRRGAARGRDRGRGGTALGDRRGGRLRHPRGRDRRGLLRAHAGGAPALAPSGSLADHAVDRDARGSRHGHARDRDRRGGHPTLATRMQNVGMSTTAPTSPDQSLFTRIGATARTTESRALLIASAAFVLAFAVALLGVGARSLPISGAWSLGAWAAVVSAVTAAAAFAVGYLLPSPGATR